jgi:hydrogenase nickel incorporation protein HypB
MQIPVERKVLEVNDLVAERLRSMFESYGVYVVNVLGSPGSGKTSLIERTIERLNGVMRLAVIEGDLATSMDADRIRRFGVPVIQINTGGICHLDAPMVENALSKLEVQNLDLLIIENVGNLVCPVQFDLGESSKVIVSSIPEGYDKVAKYPTAFSSATAVILNKIDLLSVVDFDLEFFEQSLHKINPNSKFFRLSCYTGQGIDSWVEWLSCQCHLVKH